MLELGVVIVTATVVILAAEFLRHRRRPLPIYGWLGLASLICAQWLMFRGGEPVATYFTPIAWTSYILVADAAVFAVAGHSRLRDAPRQLLGMAVLSIPLWLVFEAYNLRLHNWAYDGVPSNWLWAALGYGWSFATIIPSILETADWVESFGWFAPARRVNFSPQAQRRSIILGAALLLLPWLLPRHIAAKLFAFVWLGFIFLLDPINDRLGLPSLERDLAQGRRSRLYSLLISGWVCGWLWEFWNYWAAAKWHYIFPVFQGWKIFEMPALGYIGFLPFALECFVMYTFAAWAFGRLRPQTATAHATSDRDATCNGRP